MDLAKIKKLFLLELEKSLRINRLGADNLHRAMSYALLGEGKRIRPLTVFLAAKAATEEEDDLAIFKKALPAALAVEYIHTYSLVHDDLPCMDNDDYRRGKLSLHVQFDEALAVLAGDALLTEAFFILAQAPVNPLLQLKELALGIGRTGLILGQVTDLSLGAKNLGDWRQINLLKTAKLFSVSMTLGALCVGANKSTMEHFRQFGLSLGELFQLRDDLKDQNGLFHILGEDGLKKAIFDLENILTTGFWLTNKEYFLKLFNIS